MTSAKRRVVRLFGREYAVLLPSLRDPRLHVAAVLGTLQVLGQTVLGFRLSVAQILVCLATGALIEFVVAFFKDKALMWPASGLLTGNSAAFILRTPGTLHGQWWSTHGIWVFVGVVAVSMASKYLIRWRGRHIFNPSNLGLVIAFVALGPRFTEPQDLWWIPMGPWLIVTYAVLIVGGLLIAWELRLLGLELGFMAAFAGLTALALAAVPDHCMVASWHVAPLCGWDLWPVLVTSPEVLVFVFFMIPDPRTVPDGPVARIAFGIVVAILSVLLLGPTTGWVVSSAGAALPPPTNSGPAAASAPVWILPSIPTVTVASNVSAFDQSAPKNADKWARDVVLDLVIESEARRAHDLQLAGTGATGDALKEFVDVVNQDIGSGKIIQKTYSFDKVSLNLFLPKFSSQASRLVGVTLTGTSTFITRDASGNMLSQSSTPYSKSWGLDTSSSGSHQVIINDYTDLAPAP